MKEKIRSRAKFKKIDLFNTTLHMILYPEDGLRTANKIYELKEGQIIEIVISTEND